MVMLMQLEVTALMITIIREAIEIFDLLVENNADVTRKDYVSFI